MPNFSFWFLISVFFLLLIASCKEPVSTDTGLYETAVVKVHGYSPRNGGQDTSWYLFFDCVHSKAEQTANHSHRSAFQEWGFQDTTAAAGMAYHRVHIDDTVKVRYKIVYGEAIHDYYNCNNTSEISSPEETTESAETAVVTERWSQHNFGATDSVWFVRFKCGHKRIGYPDYWGIADISQAASQLYHRVAVGDSLSVKNKIVYGQPIHDWYNATLKR